MISSRMIAVVGVIGLVLLLGFCSHERNQKEKALISSGDCEKGPSELYQPPPTYTKSGDTLIPIHSDPYYRSYWKCRGGERFWRKDK